MDTFDHAIAMANDLAGSRVDPNEASKTLAYLRHVQTPDDFFSYLQLVVSNGRAVIRSNQTLDYYRSLLTASERHLRDLSVPEMQQVLGWAIRIMRYYRAVPDADYLSVQSATTARPEAPSRAARSIDTAPPAQQLEIGSVFLGRVIEVDDSAVLLTIPGFTEEQAIALISAATLQGRTNRYKAGNTANVEITSVRTLKSGRKVLEVRPHRKSDQS